MKRTAYVLVMFANFLGGYAVGRYNEQPAESVMMRVTAYCQKSCCCGNSADGITANGHRIKPGEKFCAADKRFAFGTMFKIPGYNEGQPMPCWDRGGKIKGNCIDVYFDDKDGKSGHQRAVEWGVKYLNVEIAK